MKVFISWSGERSRKVGELFNEWIQCVLQAAKPWISNKSIERGTAWFGEVMEQLNDTTIGIICITKENKDKPWILFEAGALAKGLTSSRVCTFLIDLEAREIEPPLGQLNHTFPTKESVLGLLLTINNKMGETALKESVLLTVYDTYWPKFKESFDAIIADTPETTPAISRDSDDILNEILMNTRSFDKRITNLESNIMNPRLITSKTYESSNTASIKDWSARVDDFIFNELNDRKGMIDTVNECTDRFGISRGEAILRVERIKSKLGLYDDEVGSY